jgi:predicted ATP-grasp superfamily ATP-dependent carboligase
MTPADLDLRFPVIIKPLTRRPELWRRVAHVGKAMRVDTPDDLRRLWPDLAASGVTLLAQELIAGPESCVESYHVYVDEHDEIVGEFTGRKVRTYPRDYGDSSALVTTDAADVAALGRKVVRRLGLRGVAKLDFKRAADGGLHLLEVNPRFNLWHHLGAIAGVNLPAMVYNDAVGMPRHVGQGARSGVRWCRLWQDVRAARDGGSSTTRWLPWALACEAKRMLAWDDPLPFLCAVLWRALHQPRANQVRK